MSFFDKIAWLRPATLLKRRLWHRSFPVNFVKYLRKPFQQNSSERLLVNLETAKASQQSDTPTKILRRNSNYFVEIEMWK